MRRSKMRASAEKIVYEGNIYRPLTEGQIEEIHNTSLKIFEEVGVCIKSAPARELWRKAGAVVEYRNMQDRQGDRRLLHRRGPKGIHSIRQRPKAQYSSGRFTCL